MKLVCIINSIDEWADHVELPDDKEISDLYDEYCKWHRSTGADPYETAFSNFLQVKGYKLVDIQRYWI